MKKECQFCGKIYKEKETDSCQSCSSGGCQTETCPYCGYKNSVSNYESIWQFFKNFLKKAK